MELTRRILFSSLLLLIFTFFLTQTSAKILIVDDTDGKWSEYTYIQDAIDNATTNDSIRIFEGTYDEELDITYDPIQNLSLIGNGTGVTIIKGTNLKKHTIIRVATRVGVYLSDFTIDGESQDEVIIGIGLHSVYSAMIENIEIVGCHSTIGYNHDDDRNWEGVGIITNSSFQDSRDRGISINNAKNILIENCTFEVNIAASVSLYKSSNITINDCLFFSSNSSNDSIGINVKKETSSVFISNCQFLNLPDIGIRINESTQNVSIYKNYFRSNAGYAIQAFSIDNIIFNNSFSNINNERYAIDLGGNKWYKGDYGNYWSDYLGIDSDYDGIGDTPYEFDVNAIDNKPLMYDPTNEINFDIDFSVVITPSVSLVDNPIMIISTINSTSPISDVELVLLVDYVELNCTVLTLVNGTNICTFFIMPKVGSHMVTVIIKAPIGLRISNEIEVIGNAKRDSMTNISNIHLIIMAVITANLLWNNRREF